MQSNYDIAIIGGGMVGASMAASLADTPLEVLLVDAAEYSPSPLAQDYDMRVSAITVASQRFFQSLGVWDAIMATRAAAFRQMHVWEHNSAASIHFDGAEIGADVLGHIIENRVIQQALLDKVQHADNISFADNTRITAMHSGTANQQSLSFDNDQSCSCKLVVGADGSHSKVRSLAGIQTHGWRYDQSAIVATVRTEHAHKQTAWQCFLDDGPLAFLPLQDNLCSIVWSCRPEQAQELMQLSKEQFEQQLTQAFEYRLGQVSLCSERGVFPLQLQYVDQYVKPGIALIGDAAHSIHPLAGQGVNLGLLDAACLADVLRDGMDRHKEPGAYAQLRRYERWRKGDNLGMMFVMDAFKRLFTTRSRPLQIVRNSGIRATDSLAPLKSLIMQSAAGMRGELPSMIRNVKPS